jgi:glycosyltransferase involved in cell wall biosynthesis
MEASRIGQSARNHAEAISIHDVEKKSGATEAGASFVRPDRIEEIAVGLLTGGGDRPYVYGLATALPAHGVRIEMIGSDDLDLPAFRDAPSIRFMNLRGSQDSNAKFTRKMSRILVYYVKLLRYAATARPRVFHILWNNRFEAFDRTLLMVFYRLLGKKIVHTVHNVNTARRDGRDNAFNRRTLRIQYRLSHHLFVHTQQMGRELSDEFGVPEGRITVIPFGINNATPRTSLSGAEARRRLGLSERERVVLFFGRIAPSKGLDLLIAAFREVASRDESCRLVIAGRPDRCEEYWRAIREDIEPDVRAGRILVRAEFIPDDETEVYFKGSDVLVLPYREIYQSGVLFLSHSFGLPVIAADVGSLKDDIVHGKTGAMFQKEDPVELATTLAEYFSSDLYRQLDEHRSEIIDYAVSRHSWDGIAETIARTYSCVLEAKTVHL